MRWVGQLCSGDCSAQPGPPSGGPIPSVAVICLLMVPKGAPSQYVPFCGKEKSDASLKHKILVSSSLHCSMWIQGQRPTSLASI